MDNNRPVFTVSDVNQYIKAVLNNDENLKFIYVKGEISNFKMASNGHFPISTAKTIASSEVENRFIIIPPFFYLLKQYFFSFSYIETQKRSRRSQSPELL